MGSRGCSGSDADVGADATAPLLAGLACVAATASACTANYHVATDDVDGVLPGFNQEERL